MRRLCLYAIFLYLFISFVSPSYAATTYDLSNTSKWNIRIDGAGANSMLGYWNNLHGFDADKDGIDDVVIYDNSNSYVYILFSSFLKTKTGTGNTLNLTNSADYNIRINTHAGSGEVTYLNSADIIGSSYKELVISTQNADYNSRNNSGSIYILSADTLSVYTGTGNTVDLATSTNWSIRIDGASSNFLAGDEGIYFADIDSDSREDMFFTGKGSLYVINNSILSTYSGTGNTIDLATSTNWSIRMDSREGTSGLAGTEGLEVGDYNGNGRSDIAFADICTDFVADCSGSVYVIFDAFSNYPGTGNTIDLADTTKWNIRFDGFAYYDLFPDGEMTSGDYNNDGMTDLIVGTWHYAANSRSSSGSMFLYSGLSLSAISGTGNVISLNDSTKWNVRFDGAAVNDYLGWVSLISSDYDSNSMTDILVGSVGADNNSRNYSGSFYVIKNEIFRSLLSTTANTIDLANTSNYSLRYDGAVAGHGLGERVRYAHDIYGVGKQDLLIGAPYADYNSRNDSGSIYIVFNFPHTLTNTQVTPTSDSIIYKGTISASNSVTTISGVQYQVDGNSPSGGWSSCTADDGAFDSTTEAYTCQTGNLGTGSHTIYVRAYDANTSYTAQSRYGTRTVSIGDTNTAARGTNDAPQITLSSDGTNATGGVMTPVGDSRTNGQDTFVIIEPKTFNFSAFVSVQATSIATSNVGGLLPNPFTGVMPVVGKTKTNAVLAGGNMLGVKSGGSIVWQVGNVQQIWYKAYAPAGSDKSPAKIIPELQKKPSIVALSYTDANLIPPGKPKSRFNAKTLKLAHSVDGVTWKILPTSVVDTKNKTVAALHKVGGYYMVVGR